MFASFDNTFLIDATTLDYRSYSRTRNGPNYYLNSLLSNRNRIFCHSLTELFSCEHNRGLVFLLPCFLRVPFL